MAEPVLKFGPEWLRALSQGAALPTPPPSPGLPKYKLADYRYGREEMLSLLPKDIKMPPEMQQFDGLVKDVFQQPMAFIPLCEEEQRMWSRSVNSDAVLRLTGRGSSGGGAGGSGSGGGGGGGIVAAAPRGGRGGSVDRGRGRGRGNYFQRGMLLDDAGETAPPVGFSRQRPYERSNSLNERGSWDEWERRYDKPFVRDDDSASLQRKDVPPRSSDWRSSARDRDGEDDVGWRGGGVRSEKWGRGNWRGERDERSDRHTDYVPAGSEKMRSAGYKRSHVRSGFWDEDYEGGGDGLPEWSTEDNKDAESVGTFDASGAFLETKGNQKEVNSTDKEGERDDAKLPRGSSPKKREPPSQDGLKEESEPSSRSSLVPSGGGGGESASKEESCRSSAHSSKQSSKGSSPDPPQLSSVQPANLPQLPAASGVQAACSAAKSMATDSVKPEGPALVVPLKNNRQDNKDAVAMVKETPVVLPPEKHHAPSPVDKKDEVNFEHLKKAAENLVDTWTAEEDEKIQVAQGPSPSLPIWYYRDPQGLIQGPFSDIEMAEWYKTGYFDMRLLVRRGEDGRFCPLGDLALKCGRVPFLPNVPQPPLATVAVAPVPAANSVLNGMMSTTAGISLNHPPELPTNHDRHLRLLHQQLLQQHLIQQQLIQQQQQLLLRQQLIGGIKQPEGYSATPPPLATPQQQQHFLMQRLLAQQQVSRLPVENGDVPDPVRQFAMMAAAQMKESPSMWNATPPTTVARTEVSAGPGRWPLGVWDLESCTSPSVPGVHMIPPDASLQEQQQQQQQQMLLEEQQKKRLTEEELHRKQQQQQQEELEEQRRRLAEKEEHLLRERLRLEEMRRLEEVEERRRQEEMRLQQEMEERRGEEELRRKQAEEMRRKEEAVARLHEEREREEKRRKQQQQELDRRRQQEVEKERQRQEEKRRQELQRLQKQKQHEEEEERRRLAEEEKRRKEAEKQKLKAEKELRKQQEEALKKLQEKQKPKNQGPAWGGLVKSASDTISLAEIQKLEERKDHEERLMRQLRQRQQQQQQQLILQQQQMQMQAAAKLNLTWADSRTVTNLAPVKSLLQIQQEESEKLSQKQKKEQQARKQQQQQQANNLSLMSASVWSNASTNLLRTSASSGSVWNSGFARDQENASGRGFWDDVVANASNSSSSAAAAAKSYANSIVNKAKSAAASQHVNSTLNNVKSSTSNGQIAKPRQNKSKKEEQSAKKLLDIHSQKNDEFSQWCMKSLNNMHSQVDVPTFISFLKDVDSPYEVSDYVRSYLGDNKESHDFAKQFVEKRSEFRAKARKPEVENMWGPAPAINPDQLKLQHGIDSDGFKASSGGKKKKKKMQKVDSAAFLGFTVHAAEDRVNVGDIERVEDL